MIWIILTIFLIICVICLNVKIFNLKKEMVDRLEKNTTVEQLNKDITDRNEKLRKENNILLNQNENLQVDRRILISNQNAIGENIAKLQEQQSQLTTKVSQAQKLVKETIDSQKQLSEDAFKEYCDTLLKSYETKEIEYNELIENLRQAYKDEQMRLIAETDKVRADLEKIKQTRSSAIEAAAREQQIKDNKDNYRLKLTESALKDIRLLQSIKDSITNPIVIDKIIWSNYYQPFAKTLFPKIIGKSTACGIYKITSIETGLSYIGQARDVCDRWKQHCKNALGVGTTSSNKLYSTIRREGLSNFTFELLEECDSKDLDEKEKTYIDLYNTYDFGLNSTRGNN